MPTAHFSHDYGFDPACGMDLARLLAIAPPEPPEDFAAFWRRRYQAALALAPGPSLRATGQVLGCHAVHDLRYRSTDGVRIGGWLLLPLDGPPLRGVVIGHGYGGRAKPDAPAGLDDAAVLYPCFRGMGRSPVAGLSSLPYFHVLHGIEDRDSYVLGGCVDDLWLGVSALLALFPEVAGRMAVLGSSFAGGIGALAAPWDARIGRLHVEVPTFGHQALRLTLPSVGSCEAVRGYQRQHRFNVMETLAYYDAACAARHLDIPTLVAAALFDPAVPPPGQFAIHNAIPEAWRRLFVLDAGHFDYPGRAVQARELRLEVANFLV
ncbi:MAG: acetylxylan esterase [Pseudomonadota bacterium]|nr:acetylxylan esterase [Pseudomonadota bacterium]